MLLGIDISHYEKGFDLAAVKPGFCIVKATEGTGMVDNCCDGFITQCKNLGIPWGYYHFARTNDPEAECDFFVNHTRGYSKKGIPVLDYEVDRSRDYVGRFVQRYHDKTGVWPWVYMNNDFVQRGMFTKEYRDKCALWIARYPIVYTSYPDVKATYPYSLPGYTVVCWQFTENLEKGGMTIDGDIAYLNKSTWIKYADPECASESVETPAQSNGISVDGKWGKETTSSMQSALGTTVDGIVSAQPEACRKYMIACLDSSWKWVGGNGSQMVRALQHKIGASSIDGKCGRETVRKLQAWLNGFGYGLEVDGYCGEITVRAVQDALNNGRF